MKTIIYTFKKNIITKLRAYPLEFFFSNTLNFSITILNSLFIYKFLFKGEISKSFTQYANTSEYLSYIIVGALIYLFIVGSIFNVSRSLITEIRLGTIDALRISNISIRNYLIGNMLEHIVTTGIEITLLILIIKIFNISFSNINILSTIVIITISLLGSFGMAILVGGIMILLKDTFIIQNTLFSLVSLLCGVTFPIEYFPNIVQNISKLIPLTHSLRLIRSSVLNGISVYENIGELYFFMFLSIIYVLFGLYVMKKAMIKSSEIQYI